MYFLTQKCKLKEFWTYNFMFMKVGKNAGREKSNFYTDTL